jgi:digeranylgeranylglycerophospholipid reductase
LKYDVAVIGGSSAGLYAAEILARNGKKVILFEQADSFHPSVRTYIITPNLFQIMPDVESGLILHSINTFHLQAGSFESVLELSSPDLVIDRNQLISSLLKRAKKAGVELHFGSEFKGIFTENGYTRIEVLSESGVKSYQADNLIAADGIKNSLGKAVGLPDPQVVPILQAEVTLPEDWDPGVTRIWFEVEDTSYFYWFIPDSDISGVLGLIADPGTDSRQLLDNFLSRQQISPSGYQSGVVALHNPSLVNEKKIGKMRILRVGDAAGQVKNTTVGGTVTGLFGSKAAAQAILNERPYKETLRKGNRELDLHAFIRNLLGRMNQVDYGLLISSLSQPVLSFLRKNNRDSMRSEFWKLVFIQPRFIPLGVKLLLKK